MGGGRRGEEKYWQVGGLELGSYQANCGDKVTIYFHKRYYITYYLQQSSITNNNQLNWGKLIFSQLAVFSVAELG